MNNEVAYGIHAVASIIKNRRDDIVQLYVLRGRHDKRLHNLLQRSKGLVQEAKSRSELNELAHSEQHQGIVAVLATTSSQSDNLLSENALPEFLKNINHPALFLILDGVTDPHNFGACLRSADAAGVNLVITTKDKSVGLTPVVRKVACGAAETIPVCQVTNLARTIELLQHNDIWIYGAAGEAESSIYQHDFSGNCALVMGAEGAGLRRLTKEKCDYLFNIPMLGSVSSLNVSVATGICLFEVVRQRSH